VSTVKCVLNHESTAADRVFHALGDANRRAIIERLTRGPDTVSALARLLGVTIAATIQHLQVLQASELVRSEKAGRVRTCQIDPSGLRQAEAWLRLQRTTWEHRLDRLGDVLGESAADRTTTSDDPSKEPRS
jgi:DNA-binding transcriptional ArsR family regulator